jgi:ribosome-binding factor A
MARLLERDIAEVLRQLAAKDFPGTLWSVTKVRVTPDVAMARVYISVFPTDRTAETMVYIEENKAAIRKQIGQLVRHQMRVVPELHYYADDSLDYEATIDRLLREGGENPIL